MQALTFCKVTPPPKMLCQECAATYDKPHVWNEFDDDVIMKVLDKSVKERIEAELHFYSLWKSYSKTNSVNKATKYEQWYRRLHCHRLGVPFEVNAIVQTWWDRNCPPDFKDTVLEKIPNKTAAQRVLAWKPGERGMIIHGKTRQGKTRSVWLLFKTIVKDGMNVQAWDMVRWSDELTSRFGPDTQDEPLAWLDRQCHADILFCDDLDKCPLTPRTQLGLFQVLKYRTENNLPTIITTQLRGEVLCSRFDAKTGEAFVARLREHCEDIDF